MHHRHHLFPCRTFWLSKSNILPAPTSRSSRLECVVVILRSLLFLGKRPPAGWLRSRVLSSSAWPVRTESYCWMSVSRSPKAPRPRTDTCSSSATSSCSQNSSKERRWRQRSSDDCLVYLLVGKWDRKVEGWRGDDQTNDPSTLLLWWSQTSARKCSFSRVGLHYPLWREVPTIFPKPLRLNRTCWHLKDKSCIHKETSLACKTCLLP